VALRRESESFSVADAAELIGLKILLIRISQEAVMRDSDESNKFENSPNIAEISCYHCGFIYTYGFP
jgi:hypothetical protein